MADNLETNFEKLFQRTATQSEREQLRHVQRTLGLKDNDALWLVLLALQYYDSLYRQYPKAIGAAASEILTEVKRVSERVIRSSAESAKADLSKAVASAARDVARDVARRQMLQWASVSLVIAMLIVTTIGGGAYVLGREAGQALTASNCERK